MEKKPWVTPEVESEEVFAILGQSCTYVSETMAGCTTDGFGGQPLGDS